MKLIKKSIIIFFIATVAMIFLNSGVYAATVNLTKSASEVEVGKNVSITVSFSEKVDAAQFELDFDSKKFEFISKSAGSYSPETKTYAYLNEDYVANLGSVTFTFRAKELGTGVFSVSGVVLPTSSISVTNGRASVTVTESKQSEDNNNGGTNSNTNQNNSDSNNKKPSSGSTNTNKNNNNKNNNNKNNTNKNNTNTTNTNTTNQETTEVQEPISKPELDALKEELKNKVETDYTAESWKELQDLISKAEGVQTQEEYDVIKAELSLNKLVAVKFEKEELYDLLIDLVGKAEQDYTEESWNELNEAILTARNTELKSEYESIKPKLTLDILEEKNNNTLTQFGLDNRIMLVFLVIIFILVIIIIVVLVLYEKSKKGNVARRGK